MHVPYSIYIHVPFCTHRCAYCDFNTYAHQESLIPAYVEALRGEIEFVGRRLPLADRVEIHTVFFGGGTPSLLSGPQIGALLDALRAAFAFVPHPEVTLEANPNTGSPSRLFAWRKAGVNRLSLGLQSANPEELRLLERNHSFLDVIEAAASARKAGIHNLNLDLIYGLPEQTLASWQTTVRRALDLQPEHISAYALTLEPGTPFGRWTARGLLPLVDPDLAAEMYEWASDFLEQAGYRQYEISNWARPGRECLHNLQYWRGLPYLGLGAGAHGYANGYRYSNVLRIKTYLDRLTPPWPAHLPFPLSPAVVHSHRQTLQEDMAEYMLTGLRLTRQGVAATEFRARFGRDLLEVYRRPIEELTRWGLLEWGEEGGVLRLTRRGRLLGNRVFLRFLG